MRATVSLLLLVLSGCSAGTDSDGSAAIRTDSSGVTIVQYSRLDSAQVWRVGDQPALSIGAVDGDPEYLFTLASRAQRLANGSILVVENRDAEVRLYDPNGTHVRTIGRPGEGPGEFRWVDWAEPIRGDSIMVWDGQLRRVSVFTADGELGRLASPEMPDGVHLLISHGAFADGSIVVTPLGETPDYVLGSMIQDTVNYAQWDPLAPELLDTIVRIPVRTTYIDEDARLWPVAFTPRAVEAIGSAQLVSTGGATLSFNVHAPDGRHLLGVRVDYAARPIASTELAEYKDNRVASARDQAARAALERRLEELPFPSHYPVLDAALVDSEGDIWVRLYNPDEAAPQSWHVFDGSGRHLAFVQTPAGLSISDIQEDEIVGRWRDELGVRTVRVYALDRDPKPSSEG